MKEEHDEDGVLIYAPLPLMNFGLMSNSIAHARSLDINDRSLKRGSVPDGLKNSLLWIMTLINLLIWCLLCQILSFLMMIGGISKIRGEILDEPPPAPNGLLLIPKAIEIQAMCTTSM